MHYVAICLDKPDSQELRLLRANAKVIKSCGPFLSDDHAEMTGSMLIIEANDRKEVDKLLEGDPYRKVGLFGTVEVRGWRWVVGCPIN